MVRHQEGEAVGAVCLNLTKCPRHIITSEQEAAGPKRPSSFGRALAAALRFLGRRCVELPLVMQAVSPAGLLCTALVLRLLSECEALLD